MTSFSPCACDYSSLPLVKIAWVGSGHGSFFVVRHGCVWKVAPDQSKLPANRGIALAVHDSVAFMGTASFTIKRAIAAG